MKNIYRRLSTEARIRSVSLAFASLLGLVASIATPGFVADAHAQAQRGLPDFTDLYEKNSAAVVSIETRQKVRRSGGLQVPPGMDENDPFFEFFRRFGPGGRGGGGGGRDRDIEIPGSGSGFFITGDGYIVTNHHVVEGADEVRVLTSDKREFKAKVIGSDARTDTALIKIESKDHPKVTIGDPNKLKVGEWVVAIGQPFGLESTMTAGILSAKQRDIPGNNDLVPFLQSDVAINPGNSGGPLFNMRGEVIAINSMIFSRSGGYQGVAFSIPIDVAMNVAEQLRETGKVRRGRIGVVIGAVDRDKAEAFGLARVQGALVNEVVKGSPAEKAGIEPGDIVLKFDGRNIERSTDLPRIVTTIKPGTRSTAQVWRKGATREVAVVVEELKEDEPKADTRKGGNRKDKEPGDKANRLGLVLSPLTEDEKKELKVRNGLKIEQNNGSSRALQEGDVLLALVNKGVATELRSVDQLNQLLAKAETGSSVTFQIRRGDNTAFLSMRVGE